MVAAFHTHLSSAIRIDDHRPECLCNVVSTTRLGQNACLAWHHQVTYATHTTCYDRKTAGHSFDNCNTKASFSDG